MFEIENSIKDREQAIEKSLNYFTSILDVEGKDYHTYVEDIVEQSFIGKIFSKFKLF